MPWQKGQSGNPGGRSREDHELKALIHSKCPPEWFLERIMDFIQNGKTDKVKFAAFQELFNRAYGRPKQSIEHSGEINTGLGAMFEALIEDANKLKLLA